MGCASCQAADRKDCVVIKRDGKAQYVPVLAFTDRKTADAFSLRVIGAVLDLCPEAFDAASVQ